MCPPHHPTMPPHALLAPAPPRFCVANGGERDVRLSEEVEAAPSSCGSELSMIDERGEECEETEARPSSEEQGCAPSLEEEPDEGELCCAHGGPTLCAAALTPPPPPPRAGRSPLLTAWSLQPHPNLLLTCS